MNEEETKKFIYKKERIDWVIMGIIGFTLMCVGLIIYGLPFFEDNRNYREITEGGDINELIENRDALERELQRYNESQEFESR